MSAAQRRLGTPSRVVLEAALRAGEAGAGIEVLVAAQAALRDHRNHAMQQGLVYNLTGMGLLRRIGTRRLGGWVITDAGAAALGNGARAPALPPAPVQALAQMAHALAQPAHAAPAAAPSSAGQAEFQTRLVSYANRLVRVPTVRSVFDLAASAAGEEPAP